MNEFDLNIGTEVFCTDGKCGKLAKFAVDPDSWQVTHLIVEDGFLLKRARVFPFSDVWRATPDEIQLSIDAEGLPNYPEFREEVIEKPAPEYTGELSAVSLESTPYGYATAGNIPMVREKVRYGVSEELAVIDRGTPINDDLGAQFGKLDHFLVNAANGGIIGLVAQKGLLFPIKQIIPVSMVEHISGASISIAATEEVLKSLPQYEPEHDTPQEIDQVWEAGREKLTSTLDDNPERDRTTQVSMAFFEHPLIKDTVIEVIDERGVITLQGEVPDLEAREAAEAVAAEQPGVISVVNNLRVNRR